MVEDEFVVGRSAGLDEGKGETGSAIDIEACAVVAEVHVFIVNGRRDDECFPGGIVIGGHDGAMSFIEQGIDVGVADGVDVVVAFLLRGHGFLLFVRFLRADLSPLSRATGVCCP